MNPQLTRDLEKLVVPPSAPRPSPAPPPSPQPSRHVLRTFIILCIFACAALAAWTWRQKILSFFSASSYSSPAAAARAAAANRPISVVAAQARTGDVHIYLTGLGQVTPFETDTIRTRVDGQIMQIEFTEGQLVNKDQPLMEIDPRPYQAQLESAEGQFLKDQAALDNSRIDLDRDQEAFSTGAISDQQLATQKATVKQNEGIVETDQSQIDTAKLNLVYCHVLSPISGRIGLRLVDVGNIVHATDTTGLAVITQLQPIAVVFTLPEDDLSQVVKPPAFGVGLEVDAYDRDDLKRIATGKVEAVDNQVDPTSGTFKIKAEYDNKDSSLFPNQFVNAHLLADVKKNVILVPAAAVQHGPDGGAFVYVVKPDQTAEIRTVQEGPSEGDSSSITGVKPGEWVVTDGTDKLINGSKVTVTPADNGPATRPSGRGRRSGSGASGGASAGASGASSSRSPEAP